MAEAIVGYERIPDGDACELCNLAAGQRYKTDDLMPIHNLCGCGVEPVMGNEVLTPKKGAKGQLHDARELQGDQWVPVQGVVRGKVVKWNDETVMLNAGSDSKPRWVMGTRLDLRKPTVKKTAPSIPDVVDVDSMPSLEPTLKGQALRDRLEQPKDLFDKAEKSAIRAYTGAKKTDVAEQLNRTLRNGTFGPRSKWREIADGLDAAFDRVDPLDEAGLVYRGCKPKFLNKLVPGSVIEDAGYMSTSPSRGVAESFAGRTFGSAVFEIKLPRGMKALDINEAAGSAYGSEREVLLPRGTKMVIESIREDPKRPGHKIVAARVIL